MVLYVGTTRNEGSMPIANRKDYLPPFTGEY